MGCVGSGWSEGSITERLSRSVTGSLIVGVGGLELVGLGLDGEASTLESVAGIVGMGPGVGLVGVGSDVGIVELGLDVGVVGLGLDVGIVRLGPDVGAVGL